MKRLTTLLIFSFAFMASAQDYELFPNASDTLAFENNFGIISFIDFDSTNATSSIYWPHKETHTSSYSGNPTCIGHTFDTAWFGYKVEKITTHQYTFYHSNYEYSIDLASRNPNPDSIGYANLLGTTYRITTKFSKKSEELLFDNSIDSVVKFEVSLDYFSGNQSPSITSLKFEVSKSHGLISIPFLAETDLYQISVQGAQFTRLQYKPAKRSAFYDFSVGDIFHYGIASGNVYNGYGFPTFTNITIIAKTLINPDSVVYTADRITEEQKLNTQTLVVEKIISHDTTKFGFGNLTDLMSNELTFQSDTNIGFGFQYKTSIWGLEPSWGQSLYTISNASYRSGNCIGVPFEPSPIQEQFYVGLGRTEITEINYPEIYSERLIYFNKLNGIRWGSPYHIGIEELTQQSPLKIYPNPTSDILNIELPEGVQKMEISIIDQLGRTLLQESITPEDQRISVEALSPGMYFIQSNKGSAVPFVKR